MTFDAYGNATGGVNGSIEVIGGNCRIGNISTGNGFVCDHMGGIYDSPPVRQAVTPAPFTHGGYVSSTYYDPRVITIEGRIIADTLAEMWTALDLLKRDFAQPSRALLYRVRMQGWTESRRFTGKPADGGLVISTPGASSTPVRGFQATLIAADPRLYGETARTLTLNPNTTQAVSLPGTAPSPLRIEMDGIFSGGNTLDNDTTGQRVGLDSIAVATGETVIFDTPSATVVRGSTNFYSHLFGGFYELDPYNGASQNVGTTVTTPGVGAVTRVIFRDAWW